MKRMRSWEIVMLAAAAMVWVYASPAWAAEGMMGSKDTMASSSCPEMMAWNRPDDVSGLVGALVSSRNNEELGRVVDVTESENGVTTFLIVASCLPEMSNQLVAIPYRSYNLPQKRSALTLNLTMDEFKNAPTFSADSWRENTVGQDWGGKAYRYFESTQYFG